MVAAPAGEAALVVEAAVQVGLDLVAPVHNADRSAQQGEDHKSGHKVDTQEEDAHTGHALHGLVVGSWQAVDNSQQMMSLVGSRQQVADSSQHD
jgi:hypothetical protein